MAENTFKFSLAQPANDLFGIGQRACRPAAGVEINFIAGAQKGGIGNDALGNDRFFRLVGTNGKPVSPGKTGRPAANGGQCFPAVALLHDRVLAAINGKDKVRPADLQAGTGDHGIPAQNPGPHQLRRL